MPEELTPLVKRWVEEMKNIKSNLEYPILGKIETPICKICKHSDYHYGSWDDPECGIIDSVIPDEFRYCRNYSCPNFMYDKESDFIDMFSEEEITKILNSNE